jgi:DNA-binding CsgD family transcriptional regulator
MSSQWSGIGKIRPSSMPARAKEGRHDRLLRDLWLEQPSETIAQQFGVSRRTVTNHAKRLGLPCKIGRRYDLNPIPKETITRLASRGHTLGQIASELGRDRDCLSIAMRKHMPHTYRRMMDRYRSAGHVTRKRNKEQNNDTGTA